jgi:hypothetical protein
VATAISGVVEYDIVSWFRWTSCPELGGTSFTTLQEWHGTCSRRRKGVGSGYCRRWWKTEECQCNAHRGKQGRGDMSIGVDGRRKATTARHAYPLVTTEVAAQIKEAPRPGGRGTAARWFYLTNGDRRDDVWWPGGRCHPAGGPSGGVSQ